MKKFTREYFMEWLFSQPVERGVNMGVPTLRQGRPSCLACEFYRDQNLDGFCSVSHSGRFAESFPESGYRNIAELEFEPFPEVSAKINNVNNGWSEYPLTVGDVQEMFADENPNKK